MLYTEKKGLDTYTSIYLKEWENVNSPTKSKVGYTLGVFLLFGRSQQTKKEAKKKNEKNDASRFAGMEALVMNSPNIPRKGRQME